MELPPLGLCHGFDIWGRICYDVFVDREWVTYNGLTGVWFIYKYGHERVMTVITEGAVWMIHLTLASRYIINGGVKWKEMNC